MGYDVIEEKKLLIGKPSNIDSFLAAFSADLDLAEKINDELLSMGDIEQCSGVQLDRIGQLVCLSRQEAGKLIGDRSLAENDEIYRTLLRYKGLSNSTTGTADDVIRATQIIFGATSVVYNENDDFPATFWLTIRAPFSDLVMSIIQNGLAIVRPSGVKTHISCSNAGSKTFGFRDITPDCAGFGAGSFAQSV